MKSAKQLFRWVGVILIIMVLLPTLAFLRIFPPESPPAEKRPGVAMVVGTTNTIVMTKDGSELIIVPPDWVFDSRVVEDDIDCIAVINGGNSNGGFEETIPSRDRRPPNWEPRSLPGKMISVKFLLATNENASIGHVTYTLLPPKR